MNLIAKISILFFYLASALYGQWALWGNPSLPGGSTDKGLGADRNEIYYSLTQSSQYIDWWHAPVPGEEFNHKGNLITSILSPGFIYGLTDKVNLSINTTLGLRIMNFDGENESVHHRDEHAANDFDNAIGGILGDSKIIFRYLLKNTGAGDGYRIILGSGLTIPSKNNLTKSPFLKDDDAFIPHRHFSMSNGTYNLISDIQLYYKRSANPVFFGANFSIEKPLKENEYFYMPGTSIKAVFSTIYKRFDRLDGSLDLSLGIESLSKEYWNDIPSPNSSVFMITPSLSYLFNIKKGALSISLQKPIFIKGSFNKNEGDLEQDTGVWQLIISFRSMAKKIFN